METIMETFIFLAPSVIKDLEFYMDSESMTNERESGLFERIRFLKFTLAQAKACLAQPRQGKEHDEG